MIQWSMPYTPSKFMPKYPTNASVAEKIGLTNAGVSRIRRGNRFPSHETVRKIETEYDWPAADQFTAIRAGHEVYAAEFEAVLAKTISVPA